MGSNIYYTISTIVSSSILLYQLRIKTRVISKWPIYTRQMEYNWSKLRIRVNKSWHYAHSTTNQNYKNTTLSFLVLVCSSVCFVYGWLWYVLAHFNLCCCGCLLYCGLILAWASIGLSLSGLGFFIVFWDLVVRFLFCFVAPTLFYLFWTNFWQLTSLPRFGHLVLCIKRSITCEIGWIVRNYILPLSHYKWGVSFWPL